MIGPGKYQGTVKYQGQIAWETIKGVDKVSRLKFIFTLSLDTLPCT